MQQQRSWQKYTTLTSSLLLTATLLVAPSFAADTNQTQIQGEYLLAQASENCRLVIARGMVLMFGDNRRLTTKRLASSIPHEM